MLKGILALVTAAIIAGLFVGLVPPPAPAAAKTAVGAAVDPVAGFPAATESGSCTQAWPYYEQACLHDSRAPNSAVRTVRVVARNR